MCKLSKLWVIGTLITAWVFLIPTHFFATCCKESSLTKGVTNNYLVPSLYGSEIIATILIFIILITFWKRQYEISFLISSRFLSTKKVITILVAFFCFSILLLQSYFSEYPITSYLFLTKSILISSLGLLLIKLSKRDLNQFTLSFIFIGLQLGIWFQGVIGWWQFLTQSNLVGYVLLGEPTYNTLPKLATWVLHSGAELQLAYGTTAHPNVLSTSLITFAFLSWLIYPLLLPNISTKFQPLLKHLFISTLVLAFSSIIITQSLMALLTSLTYLLFLIFIKKCPKKITSILADQKIRATSLVIILLLITTIMPFALNILNNYFSNNYSLNRRVWLQTVSWQKINEHPLIGIGLNQFTININSLAQTPDQWRFLQPVHSVPWLWITETGIVGLIIITIIWLLLTQSFQVSLILTLALLWAPLSSDHFLLSLSEGRALFILTFITIYLWRDSIEKSLHSH